MIHYLYVIVGDSTVRTYIRTGRASVTQERIALCGAGIGLKLILCKETYYLNSSSAGLGNSLRDILRTLSHTGQEDTCRRRLYGTELSMCFCKEVIIIDTCSEHCSDLTYSGIRFNGSSENDHISLHIDLLAIQEISSLNQERSVGLWLNLTDLTLDVVNVILLHGSSVELIEVLTGSSYINIENCDIGIRPVILDEHRMLSRIHAAYLGAVGLTLLLVVASGTDALDKYDILGLLVVAHPLEMSACGAGSIHETLQLDGGDDIGRLVICILTELVEIDDIESRGYYDGTVLDRYDLVLLLVVDCLGGADLGADTALTRLEVCAVLTVDDGNGGNGLGEGHVDGGSSAKSPVELAGDLTHLAQGALGLALAAAGTSRLVNGSCLLPYLYIEVSDESGNILYLTICIEGDVGVLVYFNHLGGKDTGSAVQGGECLVELAHPSSDGRLLLDDIHLITGICDIEGSLDTRDTSSDDESSLRYGALTLLKGSIEIYLGDGCSCQDNGLLRGLFPVLMDPGALLTDVGDLHHIRVEAGLLRTGSECLLVHTGRT